MRKDYYCKVVLQPENEVRCENCFMKHISGLTFELTNLDDFEHPKPVGTYTVKSTNRKGIFLLEVPYRNSIVTYDLIVTDTLYF